MKEAFSYYLTADGLPKTLNFYEKLQLTQQQFEKLTREEVLKHCKKIALLLHPDKNPDDRNNAEAAFKAFYSAYDELDGMFNERHAFTSATDPNYFRDFNLSDYIKKKLEKLALLQEKILMLESSPETQEQTLTIVGQESFADLAKQLGSLWKSTMVFESEFSAQADCLKALYTVAKSAQDFCDLHNYACVGIHYRMDSPDSALMKAAKLGHPLAIRTVASRVLLGGIYANEDAVIPWAIQTIASLEVETLPKLKQSTNAYEIELAGVLQKDLDRVKARYPDVFASLEASGLDAAVSTWKALSKNGKGPIALEFDSMVVGPLFSSGDLEFKLTSSRSNQEPKGIEGTLPTPTPTPQEDAERIDRQKISRIILTLIENIENKKNNRYTSGKNSIKVERLTALNRNISDQPIQDLISTIQEICQVKRNPLHFWKTPDSVKELEKLLSEAQLAHLSKSPSLKK